MTLRLLVCVVLTAMVLSAWTADSAVLPLSQTNVAIHQASLARGPAEETLAAWLKTASPETPAQLLVLLPPSGAAPYRGPARAGLVDDGKLATPPAGTSNGMASNTGTEEESAGLQWVQQEGFDISSLKALNNALVVRTTASGARRLIQGLPGARIGLWGERESQLKLVRPALRVEKAWGRLGQGLGVLVGVVETGAINPRADAVVAHDSRMACPGDGWHATQVAGVIGLRPYLKSTLPYRGLAPRAALLDAGACSNLDTDLFEAIEWALNRGARILNLSWGGPTYGNYDAMALAADELIYRTGTLWVAAAGNDAGFVMSPALAHSVLAVGATDLRGTLTTADDRVASFSSYLDPQAGYAKPEIVAPGVDVISAAPGIQALARGSGSSLSAPSVTAMATLAASNQPILLSHGETLRALLIAGSVDRTESKEVDGPGEREGEGQPRATLIAEAAVRGRFGWLTMGPDDEGSRVTAATVSLRRGQTLRVALTWDQPGCYHAAGLATMADFDLILAGSKGTEEAAARHRQGAFEVLEFRAPRDGKYTLSIELVRHDTVDREGQIRWPSPAGFAWVIY